jgi:hypothetical protein
MVKRIVGAFLVLALLAWPAVTTSTPGSSGARATLDSYGQNFWEGLACGAALGAVIVGGGALAAGTGGLAAAFAVSAGLHVLAVCAIA